MNEDFKNEIKYKAWELSFLLPENNKIYKHLWNIGELVDNLDKLIDENHEKTDEIKK